VHKREKYSPKGVNYPSLLITHSNYVHQIDVVGPRYLKEDGRFYLINIIDAFDRLNSTNPDRRQNRIAVTKDLVYLPGRPWVCHSMNRWITNYLCGGAISTPLFWTSYSPLSLFRYTPSLYSSKRTLEEQNHRYSTLEAMTPNQKCSGNIKLLPASFRLPNKLTIYPVYVHLIGFIRSDRILDIFGEKVVIPSDLEYEYVWITIDIVKEKLFIYDDSKLVVDYTYPLPKSSIDLSRFNLSSARCLYTEYIILCNITHLFLKINFF